LFFAKPLSRNVKAKNVTCVTAMDHPDGRLAFAAKNCERSQFLCQGELRQLAAQAAMQKPEKLA